MNSTDSKNAAIETLLLDSWFSRATGNTWGFILTDTDDTVVITVACLKDRHAFLGGNLQPSPRDRDETLTAYAYWLTAAGWTCVRRGDELIVIRP